MSKPNIKAEIHEGVKVFIDELCDAGSLDEVLHAEIDNVNMRSWLFYLYQDWLENSK